MSTIIKALVLEGRYKDQQVRVTNVSQDEMGRKNAACILMDGTRANIPAHHLEVIKPPPPVEETRRFAKTASMPFVSGSSSSRTLTHTKNMNKAAQIKIKEYCLKCGEELHSPKLSKICEECDEL